MTSMSSVTRRSFLTTLSGVSAASLFPFRTTKQDALFTRAIPTTGEMLPVIGLGSTKAVLEIPSEGIEPIESVIHTLVQLGGRVVDTSPRTERIDTRFGSMLRETGLRETIFLATKINTTDADEGVAQMRQNQRLLGGRTLDLVQVESLRGLDVHWPRLREWKETGQVRYIGATVSTYDGYDRLEEFMRSESPDFVHLNYSVMETRAEERLLPLAEDSGIAVLTNRPFMNGNYFGRVEGKTLPAWAAEFDCSSWAQFSLKYILANSAVTCSLTETTNPRHMDENVRAAYGRLPDARLKRRMRELARGF